MGEILGILFLVLALVLLGGLGTVGPTGGPSVRPGAVLFFDDFESYAAGTDLDGQGGWAHGATGEFLNVVSPGFKSDRAATAIAEGDVNDFVTYHTFAGTVNERITVTVKYTGPTDVETGCFVDLGFWQYGASACVGLKDGNFTFAVESNKVSSGVCVDSGLWYRFTIETQPGRIVFRIYGTDHGRHGERGDHDGKHEHEDDGCGDRDVGHRGRGHDLKDCWERPAHGPLLACAILPQGTVGSYPYTFVTLKPRKDGTTYTVKYDNVLVEEMIPKARHGTTDVLVQWFTDYATGAGEWIQYANDGTGTFTVAKRNVAPASDLLNLCRGSDFRSPDLTGDGLSDLTFAVCPTNVPGLANGVWSRANDGSGGFGPPSLVVARDWIESFLAPGDFDGDGDVDYIFGWASYGSGPAVSLRNDGGVLREIGTFTHPCSNAGPVFAHDWNGDGHLDLMMICAVDYSKVLLGDGNFGFSDAGVDWAAMFGAPGQGWKQTGTAVGSMDFDGDGSRDDVFIRSPDGDYLADREFRIYCGQGGGTYSLCLRTDPGTFTVQAHVLDLERDGDDDLLLLHLGANAPCDRTFHIYRNTGGALVDVGRLEPPGGLGCYPNNFINSAWVGNFVAGRRR